MKKSILSKIAKRGIEIARQCEGDWTARFALGMKQAWSEYKTSKNGGNKMKSDNLTKKHQNEMVEYLQEEGIEKLYATKIGFDADDGSMRYYERTTQYFVEKNDREEYLKFFRKYNADIKEYDVKVDNNLDYEFHLATLYTEKHGTFAGLDTLKAFGGKLTRIAMNK